MSRKRINSWKYNAPRDIGYFSNELTINKICDSAKEYPVPFFVTSTKDDRVHPGHARKMAKKFEDAELPFYYYENTDGGHSAAANQTERAKRSALEFTYLKQRLFGGK